ncbi:MAG: cobalt ECF transporter T component CbiQ [Methermicoccaceae archaeon]
MKIEIHEVNLERMVVEGDSPLHNLDARVKLLGAVALIFGIISMQHPVIPFLIFLSATLACLAIGMPLKVYAKRLVVLPFSIAFVVLVVVLFTYGGAHQIASVLGLPIYTEALSFAVLLFSRIVASISVLTVFIATTRVSDASEAMLWFRIPKVVVDLTLMMLRYIHLLSQEATTMYHAHTSRCGFSKRLGYRQKVNNLATIAGSLILRALKRGERVYAAMLSRGYTTETHLVESEGMSARSALLCAALLSLTVLLVLIDHAGDALWVLR